MRRSDPRLLNSMEDGEKGGDKRGNPKPIYTQMMNSHLPLLGFIT